MDPFDPSFSGIFSNLLTLVKTLNLTTELSDRTEESPDLSVRSGPRKQAKNIFPLTRHLMFGFRNPERYRRVSSSTAFHSLVHLGPKRRFYPEGGVDINIICSGFRAKQDRRF